MGWKASSVGNVKVRDLPGHIGTEELAQLHEKVIQRGYAVLPLLAARACADIRALYDNASLFRKRVIMERHAYGRGEYCYFSYPLPAAIAALRQDLYRALAPAANEWAERLGKDLRYPAELDEFSARCHALGQTRPTPLLLKYGQGDYNHLHQDLYGELYFPFQVAILLNSPGDDFTGGEFVLTESRPRVQSRPTVVPLKQGDALVFAVNERPEQGSRGYRRVVMRHGVSEVLSGERHTLGLIMHDAR